MVEEEADIEETEATWEDDTQTATNVFSSIQIDIQNFIKTKFFEYEYNILEYY